MKASMLRRTGNTIKPRRAFTLTELLVVVSIIVLLLGTLFVAINAASKRAQAAKTQFLMNTISSGLAQFNTDFGYFPPVLGKRDGQAGVSGVGRDVLRLSDVAGTGNIGRQQNWYSFTTLAEYLLGYGHRGEDGYGIIRGAPNGPGNREAPPFGIRSPGTDGCWGAVDAMNPLFSNPEQQERARGFYRARNPNRGSVAQLPNSPSWNAALVEGRVYGPYIDQMDERMIGGLNGFDLQGNPQIVTNDQGVANFDQLPKVILDYWGGPIAYYRAPYRGDDLRSNVQTNSGGLLNLGDIFCLRQWEISIAEQSAGAADPSGDTSSSAALKGASVALLSTGADRSVDRTVRRDLNEFNKDNVLQSAR